MTFREPAPWPSVLVWAVVAALAAFGIVGIATIGLFLLAGAALVAGLALATPALRPPSLPGLLVGLSTAPLYIGWLNRDGPGTVCTTTADSTSCGDQWSPWPFVVVGALLAGCGVALLVLGRRWFDDRSGAAASAVETEQRT